LAVAPRQRAGSRVPPHLQLSGKTSDICRAPSTLISGLSPADIVLFPKHKTTLKGHPFQTKEEIQENAITKLRAITEIAFQEALQQWKKRWERFIASRGNCFEGNSAKNAVKWAIKSL